MSSHEQSLPSIKVPSVHSSSGELKLCPLPCLQETLGAASVTTYNDRLVINTGRMEREWMWTGHGLVTTRLCNVESQKEWGVEDPHRLCDWDLPGTADAAQKAKLVSLTATAANDEGFTSPHLCVTAAIEYPELGLAVNFVVWAYPGAPGLRTQLHVKELANYRPCQVPAATGIPRDTWVIRTVPESVPAEKGFRSLPIVQVEPPEALFTVLIELQQEHALTGLGIVPINNSRSFGLVQNCQITVSHDGSHWSQPIYEGNINPLQRKGKDFEAYAGFAQAIKARYIRLLIPYTAAPLCKDWGVAADDLRLYSTEYPPAALFALRSESISGAFSDCTTLAIGYYGGTQARNGAHTPILHKCRGSVPVAGEFNSWANAFCVESSQEGLMLVQESHKMVNQPGHDTGGFMVTPEMITASGWGLLPHEIALDGYKPCWANWVLVYSGGENERQLAIKQFDRLRYPLDSTVDLFCQANTWSESGPGHVGNAAESEVMKELASVADLGLDMLVVDHGWQVARGAKGFVPEGEWKPHPDVYPQGWKNVVAMAQSLQIKLGLWALAQSIPLDMMKWNYDQARFMSIKLDFARLDSHDEINELMHKVREYIKYTGFQSRICWDTTEVAPRYGYYFAREYGYLHAMNRKPTKPATVTYIPWLVLRDHWHLAHYTNTNQYQMICQNIDIVDRNISDAYLHNHPYALAITLMGLPEFLQSTYVYTDEARAQLRPLISLWKQHRDNMFKLYVFPIGDEPNNASWTGFQFAAPDEEGGYILVFRELHAPHAQQSMALRFLHSCELKLTDLCAGDSEIVQVQDDGRVDFTIDEPAGFKFIRYEKRLSCK